MSQDLVEITDYYTPATQRFIQQYKGLPLIAGLCQVVTDRQLLIEQGFLQIRDNTTIFAATGINLDHWGDILNEPRNGITSDSDYRLVLLAKIAANVSKGTPEELISVYFSLMDPDSVSFVEYEPASFILTAYNPNPIGDTGRIRNVINVMRAAGVQAEMISYVDDAFAFVEDTDPDTLGFGDATDGTVGGTFASVI